MFQGEGGTKCYMLPHQCICLPSSCLICSKLPFDTNNSSLKSSLKIAGNNHPEWMKFTKEEKIKMEWYLKGEVWGWEGLWRIERMICKLVCVGMGKGWKGRLIRKVILALKAQLAELDLKAGDW